MGNKLFYRVSLPVFALALAGLFPMRGGAQTIRPSTQKELKIYDPSPSGTGNIGLRAASGTGSYSLTLPTSAPAANQVLGVSSSSGGVATLTWTTPMISFSGGTTGLTPSSASTGVITLAGTLSVTNGGTGTTSLTGIALGNGTGALTGITTSSGIAGALSDETGSGALVFGTSPTVTTLTVASGGATISAGGLTVTAGGASVNGNILIDNSGSAGELRLREPSGSGSHYTAFRAQAQSVDVTYTLPATAPTSNGQVLSSSTGGSMSWITPSSGWALTGNAGTNSSTEYLGTSDAQPLIIRTNLTTRLTIAAAGDATFTGNVTAPAFFESSDLRLKDIIKRDGDLIYFKWKDRKDDLIHIGYAAQEVQQKNPDQVRVDQAGMLAVNYIEILTEKVRMLEKRIEQLEKKKKR